MTEPKILWKPDEDFIAQLEFIKFKKYLEKEYNLNFEDYNSVHSWSISNIENFWRTLLFYFNILYEGDPDVVLETSSIPIPKWFPNVKLNYTENILYREELAEVPLIGVKEDGTTNKITSEKLKMGVGAIEKFLLDSGIKKGDRIASIMPNVPESIIASLAASSMGAIWSSTSPDFGLQGILDRFSQIEPKILFAVDGYTYNGKIYDKREMVSEIVNSIKSIEKVVIFQNVGLDFQKNYYEFNSILKEYKNPIFEKLKFDYPLWILYSSGTTGPPKAIVHGHGNILLEHMKLLKLHYDVKKGRKFFWYTTTGWMMWNVLLSSIGTGATAIIYDGSTTYHDNFHLWRIADEIGISFFGTSAAYLTFCMKEKLEINKNFELKELYAIGSTGSPLPPEAFRYVYSDIKKNVMLASISGGTDVCTAFLGGCPTLPVYEGELQCINLGADIHSFDDKGQDIINEMGELVVIKPYISMPIFLWNDYDFKKYLETYYEKYKGYWNHGDWIIITERKTAIILGRSDSTLKRKGIRIGTSEIYRVVEKIPEVKDSLIIGLELKGGNYYMPLFVVSIPNVDQEKLKEKIVEEIKKELSPRHVPDEILFVKEIPRTINGKKMEVPIKRIFLGIPIERALNISSMQNPSCIDEYLELAKSIRKKLEINL